MVLSRCHTVLIVLVGWCLLGQTVLADIPATQPAAKTQPTETAQPEAEKQPTTLADIVTFSLQDEQLVADVHWQPQGRLMVVKLLDIPGDVRVQNLGGHRGKVAGGNNVIVMISRNNGQDQDFNQIIINTGQVSFFHNHNTGMNGINGTQDSLQLTFTRNAVTLNAMKIAGGQIKQQHNVNAPSWTEFLEKHPDEVDKDIRPLLETLHLETLLGTHDMWAYQVLAERLTPSPSLETQVKQLIEQFDDVSPEKRDDASNQLKKLGNPALAVLAHLDRSQLSPEQGDRIGQVAMGGFLDGTQVKAFKADKKFLLDCLQSRDEAVRRAAAAQLQAVVGQPIDYDPAGTPAGRGVQTHRLRQLLVATTQPSTQP